MQCVFLFTVQVISEIRDISLIASPTLQFEVTVILCITLHNEKLRDLYSSPSIIRIIKPRRIRWVSHVARMGEKRNDYRLLVGRPEGKKPLGRPKRRWMDNVRMDLGEVGWGDVDWIVLAKDRNRWRALVNSVLNLRVP
jgi:hypothetical protein